MSRAGRARAAVLAGALLTGALLAAEPAAPYPLDGALDAAESTGIPRLEAYRRVQAGLLPGRLLPSGALLPLDLIRLRLPDRPDFRIPAPDPELSRRLRSFLGPHARVYGVAVLDISDPGAPRYAAFQPDRLENPGSVGKLVVALAFFQALADRFPDDPTARVRLLRETQVTGDAFVHWDEHEVPFWSPGDPRIVKRRIRVGDRGNLYTWLDWMLSSSNNAAASMVIRELLLLRRFGEAYPPSPDEAEAFFRDTPKPELARQLADALGTPVVRAGLDPERLRQGSFFTREGKARVPGRSSYATPAELVRLLVKLEQGTLVDTFSSLEIKRLLYLTDRRIRYASHPALAEDAIFFKSGSLYSCKPEPDFVCEKYHGNVRNVMNSVAIVETPERRPPLRYLVAVTSNVLRENSAVAHQTLALRIHRMIEALHPALPPGADEGDDAAGEAPTDGPGDPPGATSAVPPG